MRQGPPRGFNKHLTPSAELAAIVGPELLPRTDMVKRVWEYIKAHNLQDPKDKRVIVADAALKPIIGERCNMMAMMGLLSPHLK